MTVNSIADESAIRSLIGAYDDAVHRRDSDAWGATWEDDAVWTMLGNTVQGKDAIVTTWQGAMAGFQYVAFFSSPGFISVSGDEAVGRVYTTEWLVDDQSETLQIVGVYDDAYRRGPQGWRFARRVYHVLMQQRIAVTERTILPVPS